MATGQGTALNANDLSQGQLGFNVQSGIGNADANADLAKYTASGNLINGLLKVAGLGTSIGGSGGFAGLLGSGSGGSGYGGSPATNPNLNPATYGNIFGGA